MHVPSNKIVIQWCLLMELLWSGCSCFQDYQGASVQIPKPMWAPLAFIVMAAACVAADDVLEAPRPAYHTAPLSRAGNLQLLQSISENNALLQQIVKTENTTLTQLAEEVVLLKVRDPGQHRQSSVLAPHVAKRRQRAEHMPCPAEVEQWSQRRPRAHRGHGSSRYASANPACKTSLSSFI